MIFAWLRMGGTPATTSPTLDALASQVSQDIDYTVTVSCPDGSYDVHDLRDSFAAYDAIVARLGK